MRIRSDSTDSEGFRLNILSGHRGRWIQRLLKRGSRHQASPSVSSPDPVSDEVESPTDEKPEIVTPTFEELLEQRRLCEASQLLIEREERLFDPITDAESLPLHTEEVEQLCSDHRELKGLVVEVLQHSLSLSLEVDTDTLTSAVKALYQEEEQDQLWTQKGGTPPAWRPGNWKETHDATLRDMVKARMDSPLTPPPDHLEQSSVQLDVNSMGRQLKDDLLWVVEVLKLCYPAQADICNVYARMYHHTFSSRLTKIADFGLGDKDCTFLLCWVNQYYPEILSKQEVLGEIDGEALGKLLPADLLQPLEEQYLSHRETELTTYISRILDEVETRWRGGEMPRMEDGCYVSPVAYDIIQVVNGMVTSSGKVVGGLHKAQSITGRLCELMERYQNFQENIMKQNRENSRAYIEATTASVRQFRDFLLQKTDLFPEDAQGQCLKILSQMKTSAHAYLLKPVHDMLKPKYRKLGTYEWLKKGVFENLLVGIEAELQDLRGLGGPCHQELMCQFHEEVTAEYVKRLLKGEIKLKDREQQVRAYNLVIEEAQDLYDLFTKMGSQEVWLKDVLLGIAEVLKLQDLPAVQMQIATIGATYPDLSEKHVSALLKLKTNVSRSDRKVVKQTLSDLMTTVSSEQDLHHFFSKVHIK